MTWPPMRGRHAQLAKGPKPFQREPEPLRVRTSRDAFRRIERRLAMIEARSPGARVVDQGSAT